MAIRGDSSDYELLEKWAKKTLKQPEDEPVLYSEFDNATVGRLLHEISETAAYMKKRNNFI